MEAVCQLFEAKLKQMNPDKKKITYDITDLFEFIDSLPDLGVLVYVNTDRITLPSLLRAYFNRDFATFQFVTSIKQISI